MKGIRSALFNGALYFALVFACGFVLGVIRTLLLVPEFGERTAELMETPVMWLAITVCCRWLSRSGRLSGSVAVALLQGIFALVLLLAVEFSVVLGLRGLTLETYFASRDPVAGLVYLVSLLYFALLPAVLVRIGYPRDRSQSRP